MLVQTLLRECTRRVYTSNNGTAQHSELGRNSAYGQSYVYCLYEIYLLTAC